MKLRHKLRKLRGDQPIAEIARAAHCSGPTIADIEAGRTKDPKFSIIAGAAGYFAVPLDWLADDSQPWPPPPSDSQQAVEMVRAALAKEGLAGELDKDERRLLAAWRALSDADRTWILGCITGLDAGGTEGTADFAAALRRGKSREASNRTAG